MIICARSVYIVTYVYLCYPIGQTVIDELANKSYTTLYMILWNSMLTIVSRCGTMMVLVTPAGGREKMKHQVITTPIQPIKQTEHYKYYVAPDGDLYRLPASIVLVLHDVDTGMPLGARWEAPAHMVDWYLRNLAV